MITNKPLGLVRKTIYLKGLGYVLASGIIVNPGDKKVHERNVCSSQVFSDGPVRMEIAGRRMFYHIGMPTVGSPGCAV